ncbi:MAG: response regulator [FCB group bacterium]|nr:response regulator [FCB group bacterium]
MNTILIVDDSAIARIVIKRCLEIAGFSHAEFLEAKDGVEALKIAENTEIDLLITDLNMPNMDGVSLLKHVKSSPRLTFLPVLVVTSSSDQTKAQELQKLGALDVLNKPISPAKIASVLQSIIDKPEWG